MSLATICQDAADEIGIFAPSTYIGNSDDNAERLLAAAKAAGRHLSRMPWPAIRKEATFSTVASQAAYVFGTDLPTDVEWIIDETIWDRDNDRKVHSVGPREWQRRQSGITITTDLDRVFTIRQDSNGDKALFIDPTPSTVDTLAFEYVSDTWLETAAGSGLTAWTNDTDVPLIDEDYFLMEVIWRVKRQMGLAYFDEKIESQRMIDQAFARERVPSDLRIGGKIRNFVFNLPESDYGS